jgi:hypothetical protein
MTILSRIPSPKGRLPLPLPSKNSREGLSGVSPTKLFGNAGFFTPRLSDNVVTTRQNPVGLAAIHLQQIYN